MITSWRSIMATTILGVAMASVPALSQSGVASTAAGQSVGPAVLVPSGSVAHIARTVEGNPDSYSGIYFDSSKNEYVVAVPAGQDASRALESVTRGAGANSHSSGSMVAVTVEHQARTLSTLRRIVADISESHLAPGVSRDNLSYWYIDEKANVVRLGLVSVNPSVQAGIQRAYGNAVAVFQAAKIEPAVGHVTVRNVRLVHGSDVQRQAKATPASPSGFDRVNDGAVQHVGDRIITYTVNSDGSINLTWCTDGFQNFSGTYLYTAGHCFLIGTPVWQGFYDPSSNTFTLNTFLGNVADVQWGNGRIDAETIGTAGNAALSGDEYEQLSNLTVVDELFPGDGFFVTGASFCTNGSITQTRCNATVLGTNSCYQIGAVNVCGLDVGQSNDKTSRIVDHGDSGGPVDGVSPGQGIGGLISAGDVGAAPGDGPGDTVFWTEIPAACAQVNPFSCN